MKSVYYAAEDFLKDCPNYQFIPTTMPAVPRIVAIGDIHGDLKLAIKSMKLANLIDDKMNWIAEPPNTVVVQVGDQIDSCRPVSAYKYDCHNIKYPDDVSQDMNVLDFFDTIDKKARVCGGAVYSLLGNHEIMNAQGNFTYTSYANYYDFRYQIDGQEYRGEKDRQDLFRPGGRIANHLACTRPSVLVIGSTLFVHAGLLPVLAKRLDFLSLDSDVKLEHLNAIVRKWLLHKISTSDDTLKKSLLNGSTSPFWTRIYGNIPINSDIESEACFDSVKEIINIFKIGQLVVGHTPQLANNGINGTCYSKFESENKLYRIDGGFAHAFKMFNSSSKYQVLEIINDSQFIVLTSKD